jgi:hypothetical protein
MDFSFSLFLYLYFSKAGRKDRGERNLPPNLFERSFAPVFKTGYGSGFAGKSFL